MMLLPCGRSAGEVNTINMYPRQSSPHAGVEPKPDMTVPLLLKQPRRMRPAFQRREVMKHFGLVFVVAASLLAACSNTVEGVKQDTSETVDAIEN